MATTLETPATNAVSAPTGHKVGWIFLSITRIAIGFYFLWAFLDKLLGLGRSTCSIKDEAGFITGVNVLCAPNPETGAGGSWLKGGHITEGYLVYGGNPHSPFNSFFVELGAQRWTDWIFMLGLLGIGAALMLGIGTKVAMFAGPTMLVFMYLTQMWPQTNPILDDHIIMSLAIVGIVLVELGHQSIGLGKPWRKLVGKNTWLV